MLVTSGSKSPLVRQRTKQLKYSVGPVGPNDVDPAFGVRLAFVVLQTIGHVAARAGVAISAVRYYERRGLLAADARQSGQRRYTPATLRRLVFIGMLQDAGLALEEIAGILDVSTVADWKTIAARRLDLLDDEIRRLEIDRRLVELTA